MSRPTVGKRFRQATRHEREVLRVLLIELRRALAAESSLVISIEPGVTGGGRGVTVFARRSYRIEDKGNDNG